MSDYSSEESYIVVSKSSRIRIFNHLEEAFSYIDKHTDDFYTVYCTKDYTMNYNLYGSCELNRDVTVLVTSYYTSNPITISKFSGKHFTINAGTLILKDVILDGQNSGGGIEILGKYIQKKTPDQKVPNLIMENGAVIQNCSATDYIGGVIYSIFGNLTMNGGVIQNCTATRGSGGAILFTYGNLTINDGAIQNCTAKIDGGAISAGGQSTVFEMNGGVIQNCTGSCSGGALSLRYSAQFNMNGGTIQNNTSEGSGGGIYCFQSSIILNGGVVENNKSYVAYTQAYGDIDNFALSDMKDLTDNR